MFQPGTLIDNRYRVERLLGRGGMSNIYVCQDTRLGGTQHAVKEMTARYSNPEEQAAALNHFHREANLLARLSHPSLPTVSDYFQFQGRYYLVMEYVKGEDRVGSCRGWQVPPRATGGRVGGRDRHGAVLPALPEARRHHLPGRQAQQHHDRRGQGQTYRLRYRPPLQSQQEGRHHADRLARLRASRAI